MRHLMKKRSILIGVLALALLAALGLGLGQAQDTPPQGNTPAGNEPEAAVGAVIPIQGRLTDANGAPLSGTYGIQASIYDAAGTFLCGDWQDVAVTNGLFSMNIGTGLAVPCQSSQISGDELYLGITVGPLAGAEPEMTPRQAIYPVPYAWSLRPGADIVGTISGGPVLHVENAGSAEGSSGVRGHATAASGLTYGVRGVSDSPDGRGVYGSSTNGTGVYGSTSGEGGIGVYGTSSASNTSGAGVQGVANNVNAVGVQANNSAGGTALYARGNKADLADHLFPTLFLVQADSDGDFVVGADSRWLGSRTWRVNRNGRGYFNGGTQVGGADYAEQMAVQGEDTDYEPGDVLVISAAADRVVERSTEPYSTAVIGVYSTQPAVLAGAPDTNEPLAGVPVAILGIVPCKVSAENGPVERGDLLVSSSTPAHAMRAGANPPPGTVLGKALQPLDSGTGTVLVLVTLQ